MDELDAIPAEVTAGDEQELPVDEQQAVESEETPGQPDEKAVEAEKSRSQVRREQRKAAEARARQQLSDLAARAADLEKQLTTTKAVYGVEKPPQESDFTDYAEYVAAKAVYAAERTVAKRAEAGIQAQAEETKKQVEEVSKRERDERMAAYWEQVAEAKAVYPDYDTVVHNDLPVSVVMGDAILGSDAPTLIMYHLGKNPDEARRISNLSPLDAAREIGRIEARLTAPKARTETSAPAPVNPVRPGGVAGRNPENMSFAQYAAARRAGKI